MRRAIAALAAGSLAALVLTVPAAHADTGPGDGAGEPYNCELLLADTQDRLSTSIALNYALNVQVDQLTGERDHLAVRVDRLTVRVDALTGRVQVLDGRVERKQERIDRLRARLAAAR